MSTGGSGGENIGGISSTVEMDDSTVAPALARLKAAMDATAAKMQTLRAAFAGGAMDASEFAREMGKLDAAQRAFARQADGLRGGVAQVGGSMKSMGNTVLFATNALQDFSAAGMRGVTNNIPQLVMAMGGGAGLAGAIMLVGLGVELAGPKLYEFGVALGEMYGLIGEGKTLSESEEMEKLAKSTGRTADETRRLNEYKKEQQQIDAMLGGKTKSEKAVEAGVQGVFDEAPAKDILKGILGQRLAENAPLLSDTHIPREIEQKKAELERANRILQGRATMDEQVTYQGNPGRDAARLEAEIRTLNVQKDAARRKDAERIMLQAKTDPSLLIRDVERRPDLFPEGTLDKLREQTPGAIRDRAIDKETDERLKAKRKDDAGYLAGLNAGSEAEAEENDANFKKRLMEKVRNRIPMTEGERAAAPKDVREAESEALRREGQQHERLGERRGDLNERLRQLRNPERQGQTLGGDAYAASFHSMTGDSPEVKRLLSIEKVLEQIRDNERDIKAIGVRKR